MMSVSDKPVHDIASKGFVLWFTGMSGAGKTTLSGMLKDRLQEYGWKVELFDGDSIRNHLSADLGFSKADRHENIRRIGSIAEALSRQGVIVIVAAISPYREARQKVRTQCCKFVEVYAYCPLGVLINRDVKGLYKKALNGEIKHFTGISDPYEEPLFPEVIIDSSQETPYESAARIWDHLHNLGLLKLLNAEPLHCPK